MFAYSKFRKRSTTSTGLEPRTSTVQVHRTNQLSYDATTGRAVYVSVQMCFISLFKVDSWEFCIIR